MKGTVLAGGSGTRLYDVTPNALSEGIDCCPAAVFIVIPGQSKSTNVPTNRPVPKDSPVASTDTFRWV